MLIVKIPHSQKSGSEVHDRLVATLPSNNMIMNLHKISLQAICQMNKALQKISMCMKRLVTFFMVPIAFVTPTTSMYDIYTMNRRQNIHPSCTNPPLVRSLLLLSSDICMPVVRQMRATRLIHNLTLILPCLG